MISFKPQRDGKEQQKAEKKIKVLEKSPLETTCVAIQVQGSFRIRKVQKKGEATNAKGSLLRSLHWYHFVSVAFTALFSARYLHEPRQTTPVNPRAAPTN